MQRREFLAVIGGAIGTAALARSPERSSGAHTAFATSVAALERDARGRLGVTVLDTGTGARFGWRQAERFAMCSTFKLPLAAMMLMEADAGRLRLDQGVSVPMELPPNSPFAATRRGGTATIAELCEATTTLSDNGAANLLLALIDEPRGFTSRLRRLGDSATRLDRIEPEMNDVGPGDPRDTTTPDAMAGLVRRLALGQALSGPARKQLVDWMIATQTGARRLRAGLPASWRAGDKTGTSGDGHVNDVAVIWPPNRAPLVVTAYLAETSLPAREADAIHARLGALIATSFA